MIEIRRYGRLWYYYLCLKVKCHCSNIMHNKLLFTEKRYQKIICFFFGSSNPEIISFLHQITGTIVWISSISKYLEWNSFVYNTLPFFRITYILNDLQPRSTTQGSIDVSTSIYQPWITLWSICSRGGWWLVFSEEIGWVRDAHSSLFYSARGG